MKQPDLSKLLSGDFRLISVEKLMSMSANNRGR